MGERRKSFNHPASEIPKYYLSQNVCLTNKMIKTQKYDKNWLHSSSFLTATRVAETAHYTKTGVFTAPEKTLWTENK